MSKGVVQISENGCIVEQFNCIMDATRKTGIDNSSIIKVCKNKRKKAGNFNWKYIKEVDLNK